MNNRMPIFLAKVKALLRQKNAEQIFDEEVSAHLQMLQEKYQGEGMSAPEASRMARRQFGNTTLLKQKQRESRTTMFFTHIAQDARYALRQLAKAPVFTTVTVLTLALGIGANTAVFSVMHAVLMKMLPASEPDRLVVLQTNTFPRDTYSSGFPHTSFSYAVYQAMTTRKDVFQDVMAYVPLAFSGKTAVRMGGTAEEASGDMVSGNFFSGLGVGMERGRGFTADDESRHNAVVVISAKYWSSRLSRDPGVIGRTMYIKATPFVIVGVAADGFEGTEGGGSLDFWIPLQDRPEFNAWGSAVGSQGENYRRNPRWWCLRMIARLAAGVTRERASALIQPTFQHAAYDGVHTVKRGIDKPLVMSFSAAKQFDDAGDEQNRALETLMAMVALVLLIAISNVVMLLAARNANRQREFSIRLSLGAGRSALARQLLVEGLLLVAMGGALAWPLATGATRVLGAWAEIDASVQPDATVLWFTLGILLLAALIFGLAPLRNALANRPEMTVKTASTVATADPRKVRVGNAVIVTQIAFCIVLLVGAGLLIGTLRNLVKAPLGMKADGLLVFGVHPKQFASPAESVSFYESLQQQLSALPGVTAVSMAENRPGSGWSNGSSGFFIDGHAPTGPSAGDTDYRSNCVGSNYFHTMGVDLVAGRDFSDADTATSPTVVIVNETFAKRFLGHGSAAGHTLSDPERKHTAQIIGVVKDHKYTSITEEKMPMVWTTLAQGGPETEMHYEVRVQGDPMTVLDPARKLAAQMDPDMPLLKPITQAKEFTESISQEVMFARLAGCFAVLAMVLIATGLYGTLAYRVSKRFNEFGVRMALGAQRPQLVWLVLRGSLVLTAAGVVIGVPLAAAAGRQLESSLYQVKPLDLASYIFAVGVVALVALLASAIPASRAANVNPSSALRAD